MDSKSLRKILRNYQALTFVQLHGPRMEGEDCRVYEIRQCCLEIKLSCMFMSGDTSVIDLPSFYKGIDKYLDRINLVLNSVNEV